MCLAEQLSAFSLLYEVTGGSTGVAVSDKLSNREAQYSIICSLKYP
jgi:hypothetical protein